MIDVLPFPLPSGMTKTLSLKQPFAWLIANGYLLVDDRSWGTQYRGPMLIHASKGLYKAYYDHLKENTDIPLPNKSDMDYGGVVGIANLVLCCKPQQLPMHISETQRKHFANVHDDYYGFLFEQASPLPFMPCRGKLGVFDLDLDALISAPPPPQSELF